MLALLGSRRLLLLGSVSQLLGPGLQAGAAPGEMGTWLPLHAAASQQCPPMVSARPLPGQGLWAGAYSGRSRLVLQEPPSRQQHAATRPLLLPGLILQAGPRGKQPPRFLQWPGLRLLGSRTSRQWFQLQPAPLQCQPQWELMAQHLIRMACQTGSYEIIHYICPCFALASTANSTLSKIYVSVPTLSSQYTGPCTFCPAPSSSYNLSSPAKTPSFSRLLLPMHCPCKHRTSFTLVQSRLHQSHHQSRQ